MAELGKFSLHILIKCLFKTIKSTNSMSGAATFNLRIIHGEGRREDLCTATSKNIRCQTQSSKSTNTMLGRLCFLKICYLKEELTVSECKAILIVLFFIFLGRIAILIAA